MFAGDNFASSCFFSDSSASILAKSATIVADTEDA